MFTVKYQLLRNKGRSLLMVCIAALLAGSMALYLGNIQSNETALQNLSESLPVTVRLVSRDGVKQSGLFIHSDLFDGFSKAGVRELLCSTSAAGALTDKAREEEPFVGGDTFIAGVNDPKAIGIPEGSFTFEKGTDISFLSGEEALCAVNEGYAEAYGLAIGDAVSLPVYLYPSGLIYTKISDVTLKIAATFSASGTTGSAVSMLVPVGWLRKEAEAAGLGFFAYDSCSAVVDDPLRLNEFKLSLADIGFYQIYEDTSDQYSGDTVIIEDELFIKTAGKLQENLDVFRSFLVPFFVLMVGLVTLVTFLMLRGSRRDIAISCSLGQSKLYSAISHFFSILLVDAAGCVLALPIMYLVSSIPLQSVLIICGLFLACACTGTALALAMLLRFDALALLTKAD